MPICHLLQYITAMQTGFIIVNNHFNIILKRKKKKFIYVSNQQSESVIKIFVHQITQADNHDKLVKQSG